MTERRSPLFLERQSYRRRRLTDLTRMLPVIGALLWSVPLLWPSGGDNSPRSSVAIVYLFGVWLGMVLLGALMAWLLKRADPPGPGRDG
ncbi:hypothetical protein [Shimia sp.]|uniref:hypothetical protein n=1 Tax=Shimia sp. TaxID=1954381 RepID=UPI003564FF5A